MIGPFCFFHLFANDKVRHANKEWWKI